MTDRQKFSDLCLDAAARARTAGAQGFGTLAEKRMHAVIKHYICEDERFHEIPIEGTRYLADIRVGNDITEVQTSAFYPMKKKIEYYLSKPDWTVTVVHPIAAVRKFSWVNPETFEISPARRVACERPIALLPELYQFREHLQNPRLRFRLLLLEVHDFRLQNGKKSADRKRGSVRYERMPTALLEEWNFFTPEDYRVFLPNGLPSPFTVREYSKKAGIYGVDAYSAVRVLCAVGVIRQAEPIGRAMAFAVCENN